MPFSFKKGPLEGLMIIEPKVFGDLRGFFLETYKKPDFIAAGIDFDFIQDNHSCSVKGVLRGLHYQMEPKAQGKLVRVTRGSVWDVAVDIRKSSSTFGQWFGIELSAENNLMFFIPPGFAHGFVTLEDDTHFQYKCTNDYAPDLDRGILWNDPLLAIKWPVELDQILTISEKDKKHPVLANAEVYK